MTYIITQYPPKKSHLLISLPISFIRKLFQGQYAAQLMVVDPSFLKFSFLPEGSNFITGKKCWQFAFKVPGSLCSFANKMSSKCPSLKAAFVFQSFKNNWCSMKKMAGSSLIHMTIQVFSSKQLSNISVQQKYLMRTSYFIRQNASTPRSVFDYIIKFYHFIKGIPKWNWEGFCPITSMKVCCHLLTWS